MGADGVPREQAELAETREGVNRNTLQTGTGTGTALQVGGCEPTCEETVGAAIKSPARGKGRCGESSRYSDYPQCADNVVCDPGCRLTRPRGDPIKSLTLTPTLP